MSDVDPITGQPVTAPPSDIPPSTTTVYTDTAPPVTDYSGESSSGGAADEAKAKAAEAAEQARQKASAAGSVVGEHASQVTDSAKSHAAEVTTEAKRQVSQLVDQGRSQLQSTASDQTDRVAQLLQGFGDQLNAMARGERPPEGPLADLVQEGASRAEELASRLRTGGYEMALRDVQRFARRRPSVFLATAFGAGLAAGRLLRNTDTSRLTETIRGGSEDQGSTQPSGTYGLSGQSVTNAELELSRGGVPAPMTTGAVTADLAGAPTLGDAEPLASGDPTGLQGGLR